MENLISLRIWAPTKRGGQVLQVKMHTNDSSDCDKVPDDNIKGNIKYRVLAANGCEIYRAYFQNLIPGGQNSRPYCLIVELRIDSGRVLVRKDDAKALLSPGVLLREIINHIVVNYLKESLGTYYYQDEDNVGFDEGKIQDILSQYTTVRTWGKRLKMNGTNRPINICVTSEDEIDRVLLAIPTASRLVEYSEVALADFIKGGMDSQSVQGNPDCKCIYIQCGRSDRPNATPEVLPDVPKHLTLKDFGLDSEIYQPVEVVLKQEDIVSTFQNGGYEYRPIPNAVVTLHPNDQLAVVKVEPVELSQTYDCQIVVKEDGVDIGQLEKSINFDKNPIPKDKKLTFRGKALKQFKHAAASELRERFTLPHGSEFRIERVETDGNKILVRLEMLPEYAQIWQYRQTNPGAIDVPAQKNQRQDPKNPSAPIVINPLVVDVENPMPHKSKVNVKLIYSGCGSTIVEYFNGNVNQDGRIRRVILVPNGKQVNIEIGLPTKSSDASKQVAPPFFKARLIEDGKKNRLTVSHDKEEGWQKINCVCRFFKRFSFKYSDTHSNVVRSIGILLMLLVIAAGAAVAMYFRTKQQPVAQAMLPVETPAVADNNTTTTSSGNDGVSNTDDQTDDNATSSSESTDGGSTETDSKLDCDTKSVDKVKKNDTDELAKTRQQTEKNKSKAR